MTKKTTIAGFPSKFDKAVLEQRQAGYRNVYENTDQCCTVVREELPYNLLAKVVEMSAEGYVLTSRYPISTKPGDYSAFLIKPLSVKLEDLKALDEKIRQQYAKKKKKELVVYRQKLTQQLIEADEEKEQKRIQAVKAKRLADIQAEVDNAFKSVVIPD